MIWNVKSVVEKEGRRRCACACFLYRFVLANAVGGVVWGKRKRDDKREQKEMQETRKKGCPLFLKTVPPFVHKTKKGKSSYHNPLTLAYNHLQQGAAPSSLIGHDTLHLTPLLITKIMHLLPSIYHVLKRMSLESTMILVFCNPTTGAIVC